jgi:hypothetical protein
MTFVLRLPGQVIDGHHICCLGSQLTQIVTLLNELLGDLTWYVADIDTVGESRYPSTPTPDRVGDSHQLVDLFQKVDQFLRGVFIAVKAEVVDPQLRTDVDTEDPVSVDLGDAIVEIRAFDTSYFEIITRDDRIADFLSRTFGIHSIPG